MNKLKHDSSQRTATAADDDGALLSTLLALYDQHDDLLRVESETSVDHQVAIACRYLDAGDYDTSYAVVQSDAAIYDGVRDGGHY